MKKIYNIDKKSNHTSPTFHAQQKITNISSIIFIGERHGKLPSQVFVHLRCGAHFYKKSRSIKTIILKHYHLSVSHVR